MSEDFYKFDSTEKAGEVLEAYYLVGHSMSSLLARASCQDSEIERAKKILRPHISIESVASLLERHDSFSGESLSEKLKE